MIEVTGKIKGGKIKQATWRDIQHWKYPSQYRQLWLSGYIYGVITTGAAVAAWLLLRMP